jgi:two-component system response regulator
MSDRVEILLVEDNETDAELCVHALKRHHLANHLVWLKDGADALDFLFGEGEYAGRPVWNKPSLILLDLRMPKVDGLEAGEG